MYKKNKVAVIIPAFNEEKLIVKSIRSIPSFVDSIVVVNDSSSDRTTDIVKAIDEQRLILIEHHKNQGVGGAIVSGYKKALEIAADIMVVMGGDAQMDPKDMPALLEPIIQGKAGYVKGNRLANFNVIKVMPKIRLVGNIILTLITKFSSGYWHIVDSQCGYTAVNREVLMKLDLDKLYKKYGFPNDMLTKLNILNVKVKDVKVKAIYNEGNSKLNIFSFAPRILFLSIKLFFWRILHKYMLSKSHSFVRLER